MIPFQYRTVRSVEDAARATEDGRAVALGGGTTLVDLMKLNVLTPEALVPVAPHLPATIEATDDAVTIGAGATMADVADHPAIREKLPVVRWSLLLAASPQIRNMATVGGNLLQRTRCPYFRHPEWACNRRSPGSGCDARADGADRSLMAVLGTSEHCIANYPGDFAVACVALDATLDVKGPAGSRSLPVRKLHRPPGDEPHRQWTLEPGEVIERIVFPVSPAAKVSHYLKVRERSSYAFAVASVAVGLELDGTGEGATIRQARVALGGVGTVPWHSPEAEAELDGKPATDETFRKAARAALAGAKPMSGTAYKVTIAERTLVRALTILRDEGVPGDDAVLAFQHGRS